MDETDLAWAAGFIDGEGCISISRDDPPGGSTRHELRLRAVNTDERPIKRLLSIFGFGSVHTSIESGKRPLHFWHCSCNNAAKALVGIMRFLVSKKEQAECGLDFIVLKGATKATRKGIPAETIAMRDAYYWAMRDLKTSRGLEEWKEWNRRE